MPRAMAQFAARELGRSSVAGSDVGWAGEAGDFDVAWGLVVSLNDGFDLGSDDLVDSRGRLCQRLQPVDGLTGR